MKGWLRWNSVCWKAPVRMKARPMAMPANSGMSPTASREGAEASAQPPQAMSSATPARMANTPQAIFHAKVHKVVQRHVEDLAQLQQLVHFGIGLLGLPLRDGLTADAKHEGQLFLGHRMGSAKMLKVITEAHGGPTFSERGKAAALCFRAPRRNPCHQSSPSPKDKFG